jgi:hypothetical protein
MIPARSAGGGRTNLNVKCNADVLVRAVALRQEHRGMPLPGLPS